MQHGCSLKKIAGHLGLHYTGVRNRLLKNAASEDATGKNEAKKRSAHGVHEHFGVSQISADFELAYLSRILTQYCRAQLFFTSSVRSFVVGQKNKSVFQDLPWSLILG